MSCNHRNPKLFAVVHSQPRYISLSCSFVLIIRVLEPQWIMLSFSKQMESSGGDRDSCSSSTKITGSEAATKKPRIETHSPLPTFKVWLESWGLGSMIHDLLLCIDTNCNVLMQISEESKDCDEPKQDLRSRGLCLVPVTSTYPVASETTTDFWHPTLGGTFR
ncbi:hypothetical protein BHM03_00036299 [Ensete ventricosum]|uniref:Uncharacterized protein n=1 Tax=Ensete ventricosum TaxID=4639 RepID=A0A426YHG0_ENSVE|nr:hypothetical protein B296_00026421 [Ensete ventricosum]RZS05751.1 hypothetical protein BHM03_00036299 [Ensete ventricosum]